MAGAGSLVKELREKTGAGILDCQKALQETGDDIDKAIDYLRQKGLAAAQKKSGRETNQGLIHAYIHMGGKIGVLVEVNCESDFVARTDDFNNLVKELGMHIAAAAPRWVRREDVPTEDVEKERAIYRGQMEKENKPAHVIDKIIEGKLGSFYSQFVLLDQPFVRDDKVTISQLVAQASAKTGENVQVSRFVRFRVGEGSES
jgi:elongation factor Ts